MTATAPILADPKANAPVSPSRAWLRALELTAPIAQQPTRLLSTVIEEFAAASGSAPALVSATQSFTYRELSQRARRYTRWAIAQGLAHGDTVCLGMPNCPEYLAIWLGLTQAGCTVALMNTSLAGPALAHGMNLVSPKCIIVAAALADRLRTALPHLDSPTNIWTHGEGVPDFPRLDDAIAPYSSAPLSPAERRPVTIHDRALYIFTSGTTGFPKAAAISHARILQWSYWFAGLTGASPADRLYNCLPMYHSVGGILATGALLVSGGSVAIRETFSASRFWDDVTCWDCTMFQYIGELCRYLLQSPVHPLETAHRLRLCCGNGLRPEIWTAFESRFRIPRILEFYAATEGNVSLFNVEGKPGAIGRVPGYLAYRFSAALVKFDAESGEPVRNSAGFCIPCAVNEPGEALGRIADDPARPGNRFEGYSSAAETEEKILRNVFSPGDAWFRTGDLLRQDEHGYYYFTDRIGETFRWKGENVSTAEVAAAIAECPGVRHVNVYGVLIPGVEGRAGMAAIAATDAFDLTAFRDHLADCLPSYARPLFLRLCGDLEVTGTFKYTKSNFVRDAFNPAATSDPIYFFHPDHSAFLRVDDELYHTIQSGKVRL